MGGPCARPGPRLSLLVVLCLLAAAAFVRQAAAHELDGRVVRVSDGDTLTVVVGHERVRVRLADIDAPERGQPYGRRAQRSLSDLCDQRIARVLPTGRDRYGRVVGRVSCGGIEANAEQVRRGLAWVYTRYARRDSPLHAVEREARERHRGLWQEAAPLPPWEWRRHRQTRRARA